MNDEFLIIAITPPMFFDGEVERINNILSSNEVNFVHIRKPYASAKKIEELILSIKPELRCRLKLHDRFELAEKYNLGGVHLNLRNPEYSTTRLPKDKWNKKETICGSNFTISKSLHSLDDFESVTGLDYIFLSPVFDSISKSGYKASFDLEKISSFIRGKNVIALGGVTPDKFPFLKSTGFLGAALLGYFFPEVLNEVEITT